MVERGVRGVEVVGSCPTTLTSLKRHTMGNINIDGLSPEELRELEEQARETRERKEAQNTKPEPIEDPELPDSVINMCERYIDYIAEWGYEDRDTRDYIFEAVLKAVYGDDIFDWINNQYS